MDLGNTNQQTSKITPTPLNREDYEPLGLWPMLPHCFQVCGQDNSRKRARRLVTSPEMQEPSEDGVHIVFPDFSTL